MKLELNGRRFIAKDIQELQKMLNMIRDENFQRTFEI